MSNRGNSANSLEISRLSQIEKLALNKRSVEFSLPKKREKMNESLDEFSTDNSVLNSTISTEEFNIVRKMTKSNGGPNSNNGNTFHKFQKTSSGVSSCDSLENYDIKTSSPVLKFEEHTFNKRSAEFSVPIFQGKKLKIDEVTPPNQKIEKYDDVMQNTLDSVNLSNILDEVKSTDKSEGKYTFDAFAKFYSTPKIEGSHSGFLEKNTSTFKEKINEEDLFATQFPLALTQIDHLVKKHTLSEQKIKLEESSDTSFTKCFEERSKSNKFTKETSIDREIEEQSMFAYEKVTSPKYFSNLASTSTEPEKREKLGESSDMPLMMCFKERLKSKEFPKESSIDREIEERSILFENEKVTSEYRHEVNQMFEQIESSICAMGIDNLSADVPEEILDIIFNDDIEACADLKGSKEKYQNVELNGTANINLSFGTIIKKALINNSTKTLMERKKNCESLNLSISGVKSEFKNLGPFYGLPLKVKDLIRQYKGIEELYDWQDECLKLPAIESKKNLIYALPTSGGKTLVAEILIFRELLCYKRNVIFILPYVSIVQEKVWTISPFGVALDFLVEEYASSKGVYPPRKRRRKNSIYVATIEKALGIINSLIETGRLYEIGLIVVDEFHLIGEEGRGPTLEATLTKIMFLKANIQIISMSATIGNISEICKFLNADVYVKDFRPVELIEYVKCNNQIAKINWNYENEEDLLIDHKMIDYKYSESVLKLDPDMIGGLVMEVVPKGSCLVFCASKKNCENVTNLLCKLCKPELKNYRKVEKEQLVNALKDEGGKLCEILEKSIKYGIAYHHSGLTSDERRIIEEGFRAGIIYVICCTSTLAAGVNLPAQRVILRSPYIGRDFINLSRYKQMVGRAGRAGLGEVGESILITNPRDMPKVIELMKSPMNKAISSMHTSDGKGLRHLLLSCISLGISNTRAQLQEVTAHTLLAVQKDQLEVDIKKLTDRVIKNLFKMGALKESGVELKKNEFGNAFIDVSVKMNTSVPDTSIDDNLDRTPSKKTKKTIVLTHSTKLVVSELGCAAIKGGLELSRAHILYEDLCEAQSSLVLQGHLHLLYLVTPYATAEQIKPNNQLYYEIFTQLKPNELRIARTIGLTESVAVKMLSNNSIKTVSERVINRFYLTLMLYDLWNEMPVFEVAEKYQVNRGIVQNLMTSAATFASNVVNFCEELEEFWAYAYLLKGMSQRLSHCCVKELMPLMELPAVKQSRAKQLYNAGFKTLQSIAKANVNDLVENIEFMSKRVANQLIAASKMLLLERVENLREEAEDVLDGVEIPK